MSKKFLMLLCTIQFVSIIVILMFSVYVYNDTKVFTDFVKRNAEICYEKLGAYGESIDTNYSYDSLTNADLISCMEKLKKYEKPVLILKF